MIRNTFGAEYSAGAFTLSLLAVGFLAHAIARPSGNALTSVGKTKLIMYDNVTVAVVNVALNLVLIPRYSYLGAAVTTTVGYLLMNTLYLTQLYRTVGIHPFRGTFLRTAFTAGVAASVAYGGASLLLDVTIVSLVGTFALFCAVYVATIHALGGIEEEELVLVESFEDRFGIDLEGPKRVARRVAR